MALEKPVEDVWKFLIDLLSVTNNTHWILLHYAPGVILQLHITYYIKFLL